MRSTDKYIVEERKLSERSVLQRVINAGGEERSLIIIDGRECLWSPTSEERQLLKLFKDNQDDIENAPHDYKQLSVG